MLCREVRNRTSEYLDRRLGETHRRAFDEHVAGCASCDRRLDETRAAIELLREAPAPRPPSGMLASTLRAIDRTVEPRLAIVASPPRRRVRPLAGGLLAFCGRLVVDYEFKLIAYSVGVVVTFALFTSTLAGLRPIWQIAQSLRQEPMIWMSSEEAAALGIPTPAGVTTVAYTLPRVAEHGSLSQFAAYPGVQGYEDLVVIAEVRPDGCASLVEVLSGPEDPEFVNELRIALNRPAFVPASAVSVSGRPVSSRIVLLLQRVDIVG
jgi:hypothetical protein